MCGRPFRIQEKIFSGAIRGVAGQKKSGKRSAARLVKKSAGRRKCLENGRCGERLTERTCGQAVQKLCLPEAQYIGGFAQFLQADRPEKISRKSQPEMPLSIEITEEK
jgi:hypothetical protein